MNKKRMVAVMAAATMLLNVTPVMATTVTPQSVSNGSTTVSSSGTINAYDKTPIFKVTLPTANALDFVVDPYGLIDLASGSGAKVDSLANSGSVLSASGAAAVVKNESSVPVTVTVKVKGEGSNANFVDAGSKVASGTAANIFVGLIPSAKKSDTATGYEASKYAIPALASDSAVKFMLDKGEYEVVKTGESAFKMQQVSGSSVYDATTFKVGGYANPEADWSVVASGSGVKLTAVFEYTQSADTDELDDSMGVYGLVSGSGTALTDDISGSGATNSAYTKSFDGTNDVNFDLPAGATALWVVHAGGTNYAKGAQRMTQGGYTFDSSTGKLVLKASYLNGTNTKAQFIACYGDDASKDITLTVNYTK